MSLKPVQFEISGERKLLAKVEGLANLEKVAERFLSRELKKLMRVVQGTYDEVGLKVRTGRLKGSIQPGPVEKTDDGWEGKLLVGQGVPYVYAMEFGATIKPRQAKALTIPLPAARTACGGGRVSARRLMESGEWDTFIPPGKNVIMGKRKGSSDPPVPLFALVKEVTIKPHPFVRTGVARFAPRFTADLIELVKRLQEGKGE